ncbi:unnamed protein product [Linum tenue]|uniref:Homeobox domain-containing protein n=2 Tax=Linum tenue TaxID=586396 RepID=A0AAV0Q8D6_9ROSI|nr:unnamed protein product [Linum tenue]
MEDLRFLLRKPSFECHQHHNIPPFDFFVILQNDKVQVALYVCLALLSMTRTDALYAPITYVTSDVPKDLVDEVLSRDVNNHRAPQTRVFKMKVDMEVPLNAADQAIDLIASVRELHGLGFQEISKLLRDAENFTIHLNIGNLIIRIDMEKLAAFLPLHLIAVLLSSRGDERALRYLLGGVRLLHVLCDLAPRHNKLEQILLDDVKVSEQLLDLIFYLLIIVSRHRKETLHSSSSSLLHPAVVASSLYLLTCSISTHWQDLVQVLLAHPKVNVFMDAAFGAVRVAVRSLQGKLSAQITSFQMTSNPTVEQTANFLCQQCEASVQFLHSLCQQKLFRERILRNKELCGKGGILFLVQAIMKLKITTPVLESARVVASISRIKAKALSILLNLCEAESISYLDDIASSPETLEVAKSVASEVLEELRVGVCRGGRHLSPSPVKFSPTGLLQLNALRLADVFSDDSNFRSYITISFTKVLTAIFSLPHGEFLSIWCSSELPQREEDATLEYDAFAACGWVLNATKVSSPTFLETNLVSKQERNLFLHKFLECMRLDPAESLPGFSFSSGTQKAATVCRNLRSLLCHAESLIPNFLNEEDVQLLRVFFNQLQATITRAEFEENHGKKSPSLDKFSKLDINDHQEGQSIGGKKEPSNATTNRSGNHEESSENSALKDNQLNFRNDHLNLGETALIREDKEKSSRGAFREIDRDGQNVETSGSDSTAPRGKSFVDSHSDFSKSGRNSNKESGIRGTHEDEKTEAVQSDEKQPRKRKRTIMNDYQISLIEKALLDEPDMQRNATLLQTWADRLSVHGAEVTSSQLKNWLNNRKARLARAGKDARAPMEVDNASSQEKQVGHGQQSRSRDSPESPAAEDNAPSSTRGGAVQSSSMKMGGTSESSTWIHTTRDLVSSGGTQPLQYTPGQRVVLVDGQGLEVAKGKVHQVKGKWFGKNLDELSSGGTCVVVDVNDLKADRWTRLPYPSEITGNTFSEAETKIGEMRVLWDYKKMYLLRST